MKECTLGLIYVCKGLEFLFQVGWCVFTYYEGLTFYHRIENDNETYMKVLIIICIVLATFQVMFHNFVFNFRYFLRLWCVSCCKPVYTCFYYMCLESWTKPLCRDKCPTIPTLIKWFVIYAPVFTVTFFLTRSWNNAQGADFQTGVVSKPTTNFHIICILWACMHPMFLAARVPIFILYAILTCCCDKGEVLDAEFPYEKIFISFDYIEKNPPGEDNLFRNPWQEWRSSRNLQQARAEGQSMYGNRDAVPVEGNGSLYQMRRQMRQTVKLTLNQSMMKRSCSICTFRFEVGEDTYIPTCDEKHMCHYSCAKSWADKQQRDKLDLFCPLCRRKIVFDEGQKTKIDKVEGGVPSASQMFGSVAIKNEKNKDPDTHAFAQAEQDLEVDNLPAMRDAGNSGLIQNIQAPDIQINVNVDPAQNEPSF